MLPASIPGRTARETTEAVKQYGIDPYKPHLVFIFLAVIVGLTSLIVYLLTTTTPKSSQAEIRIAQLERIQKIHEIFRDTRANQNQGTSLYGSMIGNAETQLSTGGGPRRCD